MALATKFHGPPRKGLRTQQVSSIDPSGPVPQGAGPNRFLGLLALGAYTGALPTDSS